MVENYLKIPYYGSMDEFDADVAIIGAGPLGLELAIALKQEGISFLQFDKGQMAQMVYNYPPGTHFFSSSERIGIAGIPVQTVNQQKCTREEYLAYIRSVAMHYGLNINTYEEVFTLEILENGGVLIKTSKGEYRSRFLVIATGGTSRPRLLGVPGEQLSHVSSKIEDPHRYFMKRVVIIGGKNSAVESALRCFNAGAKVTLVVRGGSFDEKAIKYWLLPELLGRISKNEISCYFDSEIKSIEADKVVLKSDTIVPADFVVKAIGFDADMSLCRQIGVDLKEESQIPVFDQRTMETQVAGVFLLGTIVGGTQAKYKVFIENTHVHVGKIVQAIGKKMGIQLKSVYATEDVKNKAHLEE